METPTPNLHALLEFNRDASIIGVCGIYYINLGKISKKDTYERICPVSFYETRQYRSNLFI